MSLLNKLRQKNWKLTRIEIKQRERRKNKDFVNIFKKVKLVNEFLVEKRVIYYYCPKHKMTNYLLSDEKFSIR